MSILNEAMLVHIRIGQWTGRKFDNQASDWVNSYFEVQNDAARVNKPIVPKSYISPIESIVSQVRQSHLRQTLPWMDNGARMLPSANYFEYMQNIGVYRGKFEEAVDALVASYPQLLQESEKLQGKLWRADQFPSETELRNKFHFKVIVMPIPAETDWRVNNIAKTDELIATYSSQLEEVTTNVRGYLIGKVLQKISESLDKLLTAQRIHDSVINNISTACKDVLKQNIINDADVDRVIASILQDLRSIDIARVRKDKAGTAKLLTQHREKLWNLTDSVNQEISTTPFNQEPPNVSSHATDGEIKNRTNSASPLLWGLSVTP